MNIKTTRKATWWRKIVYEAIIKRDGPLCCLCLNEFRTTDRLHCHHVLPVIEGGGDELDNLVIVHGACHTKWHARQRKLSKIISNRE